MDKINNLVPNNPTDFQQLTELNSADGRQDFSPTPLLWELWDRMTEYYGSAFVSQYGEEPTATWAAILKNLDAWQVREGFELLPTRHSAFPPNPGEFLQLIGTDKAWERQCHRTYEPERLLVDQTEKEKTRQVAEQEIAKMRAMFQEGK